MANKSVLELAVETGKWDAGLKKAKSALDKFTDASGGLQKALDADSDKMGKFVQMMGKADSTAKTGKGQMNDYKQAIEQLTMQFNRMTDAQKDEIVRLAIVFDDTDFLEDCVDDLPEDSVETLCFSLARMGEAERLEPFMARLRPESRERVEKILAERE